MSLKKSKQESLEYAENIIDTIRESLIVLDKDLRVLTVSRSFYEFFKVKPEDTVGELIYDLGNKQWDIPKLRELLENILPNKNPFEDYEVEHDFATIGRRIMLLNARQIEQASGKEKIILLAIEDITERKAVEDGLKKTRVELELHQIELEMQNENLKATQSKLYDSKEKYFDFYNLAPVGYATINHEGLLTEISITAAAMLGFTVTAMIDKKFSNFISFENQDTYYLWRKSIVNSGETQSCEIQISIIDGTSFWVSFVGKLVDESSINIIISDITERKVLQQKLQEERERFLLAIDGTQDGLWDWNLQTDAFLFSERFETMLSYNVGDLPRKIDAWFGLLHPDDKEKTSQTIKDYLASKGEKNYEDTFRLRAKDGSWHWILGRGKALFSADGTPLRFVGFNTDISQQMEYQNKLDHTAKHDALTHLPNRFLLSELLAHAMHSVKRKQKHLAVLFIDLDGFKEVNDTYGHEAGDKVLTTLAQRMSDIVRESDIVSRLGGDEFIIVASELKNNREVIPLLQRLLSDLSSNIIYDEDSMHVTASIGVSFYPQEDDIGPETLIHQADQAMYQAKLSGKNQYQFFNLEAF